ncbi:MAG: methylenetetrahydrofolate reductase C-terminal domain-containing protein [Proteobacteria bacterium]|nr:methylenetetrahydrofolate reductase C-terminal domain-containing protein [Pseudomonadota bacterium]MBI3497278.1 methylenetetrahydrofolate reductase C-terminal domain-containing protein [Pseudomonadota bacterium]
MPSALYAFEPTGRRAGNRVGAARRSWSVRHARLLEFLYCRFERVLIASGLVLRWIGFDRLEAPVASIERAVKGALFDCRMCGQCILSSTGMSCPMNCPKGLRNGPCGGVRPDGRCEIDAEMPCVWVMAWEGSLRMRCGDRIRQPQIPIDHRLKERSSWLAVSRGEHALDGGESGS